MINNLKLEFGEKSLDYLNGQPYRTRVVLKNDDGAYYPVFFEPDAIEKSDAELYEMALEVCYQKNSSGRAEDERFNVLGEKIAKFDDMMEKMQEALSDTKKANVENREIVKTVTMTLNEFIESFLEEGDPSDEKNVSKD